MRWQISDYQVTYTAQGNPALALHAGDRHIADIRFTDQPGPRFNVDFETGFVTLDLAATERAILLDHLRNERSVTLDTEANTLTFKR